MAGIDDDKRPRMRNRATAGRNLSERFASIAKQSPENRSTASQAA
jgi:hypothetical protein